MPPQWIGFWWATQKIGGPSGEFRWCCNRVFFTLSGTAATLTDAVLHCQFVRDQVMAQLQLLLTTETVHADCRLFCTVAGYAPFQVAHIPAPFGTIAGGTMPKGCTASFQYYGPGGHFYFETNPNVRLSWVPRSFVGPHDLLTPSAFTAYNAFWTHLIGGYTSHGLTATLSKVTGATLYPVTTVTLRPRISYMRKRQKKANRTNAGLLTTLGPL